MKDIRIAVRYAGMLWRRSRAFGLFVAVGVALVLLTGGLVAQAARAVEGQVLESTIMRTIEVSSDGVARPVPLTHARIDELANLPGVTHVRPWIQSGCLVTESPIDVPGALWATPYMQVGQPPIVTSTRDSLAPLADDEVVMPARIQGADMAPLLGQRIVVEYTHRVTAQTGEPRYLSLHVVGLYDEAIGGRDGPAAVYISQTTALLMAAAREGVKTDAFGRNVGFPKVIIETETADQVPGLQRQISDRGFNASSIQSLLQDLPPAMRLVEILGQTLGAVLLIVCLFAGLSIGASLVRARLRDIGLLKALGFTNTRVAKLIGLELGLFGLAAGVAGTAIGALSLYVVQQQLGGETLLGVPLADSITYPTISAIALLAVAPSLAMILGGILPMVRAAALPPDLAMRNPD